MTDTELRAQAPSGVKAKLKQLRQPCEYAHRGYLIRRCLGNPDLWEYAHEAYDGPEDPRCGTERTVEACCEAIDEKVDGE